MAAEYRQLNARKNNRLYSITTRLSNICIKYLVLQKNFDFSSSEKDVVDKGLSYIQNVQSGLKIKRSFNQRTFSFDNKTIESLNALNPVFLIAEDSNAIDALLETVKQTLSSIKNNSEADSEKLNTSIDFLINYQKKLGEIFIT